MSTAAAAVLTLASLFAPQQDGWLEEFAPARARAEAEAKDLLIVFTGSDWCAPCIELEQRVLAQESFLTAAAQEFVLVRLDYPRSAAPRARVPDFAANEAVASLFAVAAFPTVILTEPDAAPYARTGSRPGTVQEYLDHLTDLRTRAAAARPRIAALLAREVRDAEEAERDALVREAAAAFRSLEPALVLRERLLPLIRRGLDAADQTLAIDCLRLLLEARAATAAEEAHALLLDARNELGLYELVVAARLDRTAFVEEMATWCELAEAYVALGLHHDPDRATRILIAAAKFYHGYLARPQGARKMAERARDLGRVPPEEQAFVHRMTGQ